MSKIFFFFFKDQVLKNIQKNVKNKKKYKNKNTTIHYSIIKSYVASASLFYSQLNSLIPIHFLKMTLFEQHQSCHGTSRNIGQSTVLIVLSIPNTDILILICFLLLKSVSIFLLASFLSGGYSPSIMKISLKFYLEMVLLVLPRLGQQLLGILSLQGILALLCSSYKFKMNSP